MPVQQYRISCSPAVGARPPLPTHERDLRCRDDAGVVVERPVALGGRRDLPCLLLDLALHGLWFTLAAEGAPALAHSSLKHWVNLQTEPLSTAVSNASFVTQVNGCASADAR